MPFDLVLGDRYAFGQVTNAGHKMQRYEDMNPIIVSIKQLAQLRTEPQGRG